jgi:O-antigen/teichoic acid export membrane protein
MTIAQQAPLLFVSASYGTAAAGQLGLALVGLALPLALIGQHAGQAYYVEIARIGRGEPTRIYQVTREVTARLLALAMVPTLVLMLAGTVLFSLFFGERWHDAGVFASILSIYLPAQFVANLLSHALSVFDKQHVYLRLNALRVVLIVAIFFIAYQLQLSAFVTIAAYSAALSAHYVATSISIFVIIRRAMADGGGAPGPADSQLGAAR